MATGATEGEVSAKVADVAAQQMTRWQQRARWQQRYVADAKDDEVAQTHPKSMAPITQMDYAASAQPRITQNYTNDSRQTGAAAAGELLWVVPVVSCCG